MPIFRDPDRMQQYSTSALPPDPQYSDNTEIQDEIMADPTDERAVTDAQHRPSLYTSNREELMESIKRGESPTWIPNPSLEEYFATHGDDPQTRLEELQNRERRSASPLNEASEPVKRPSSSGSSSGLFSDPPIEIERPRSALHSGDFRESSPKTSEQAKNGNHFNRHLEQHIISTSPPAPWYSESPQPQPILYSPSPQGFSFPAFKTPRMRAPSLSSFASSYVLKPATSPLVYQSSNADTDMCRDAGQLHFSPPSQKENRRRTLPPEAFQPLSQNWNHNFGKFSSFNHREGLFSYQGHRPRRSLTSGFPPQQAFSPSSSLSRSRRFSHSSDATTSHHPSMVGSFEESILRGRMSMAPSRPLEFTAQIGVLGRGDCKANLKCPPHVTVSFPAVFYSYPTSTGGRTISDDNPSPYVGCIDVETLFPRETSPPRKNRKQIVIPPKCPCANHANEERFLEASPSSQQGRRLREKKSRRPSHSLRYPPGGCYRIPQQGQLQIVIKNPNKTAVKLFLVPYDLEGMEPGTKTFVRQRCYSIGPAVDTPLSSGTDNNASASESFVASGNTAEDKPVLRYLVHINICCPSKGRFYLYSEIRVVFANRVPDGKEKLRNEVHYPEPRFSPYKPAKDIATGSTKAETFLRRQSAGQGFNLPGSPELREFVTQNYSTPFSFSEHGPLPIRPSPSRSFDQGGTGSFEEPPFADAPPPLRPASQNETYCKLSKGDTGYGGYAPGFSPDSNSSGTESLLSQQLRDYNSFQREPY